MATTIQGKGAISDSDPWSLGVIGNNGARDYANKYVSEADVVLLVGTRANATDTDGFTTPARAGVDVIQIDRQRDATPAHTRGDRDGLSLLRRLDVEELQATRRRQIGLAFGGHVAGRSGCHGGRESFSHVSCGLLRQR